MAILTADELAGLRRRMAASAEAVDWDKDTVNAALQAVEDKFELIRSDISAAIDTAAAPFVFTVQQKKKLVGATLQRKFAREGN
ncbi:MAG: hypothetical protein V3W34_00900 [Phycisphaerae bacterium]